MAEWLDTSGGGFKIQFCLKARLKKASGDRISVHFNSSQMTILPGTDFNGVLDEVKAQILKKIDEFQQKGSGWVVRKVEHLDVHISRYQPLRGSTYVKLPKYIQDKKAVINVKNNDNECFKWAILAGLYPENQHAERVSKYKKYSNYLNFGNLHMPLKITDVSKFEKMNNLSICVYEYDGRHILPLHIS